MQLLATNGMTGHTGFGRCEIGLATGFERTGLGLRPVSWRGIDVVLVVGKACHLDNDVLDGREAWLYTMCETTTVHPSAVDAINRRARGVLVPNDAVAAAYCASGVEVPVVAVGCGVLDVPNPLYVRRDAGDDFTVLTYTLGGHRKGADLAFQAFFRLFEGQPGKRLVIKATARSRRVSWLRALGEHPQVTVVHDRLTSAQWHTMLHEADAFVFASRGEGFGLPPREAVMAGTPTVATRWLGMADADGWCHPLDVARMWPHNISDTRDATNAPGALWAEPDLNALVTTLGQIEREPEAALTTTQAARDALTHACDWQQIAQRIHEVVYG